MLEFVVFWFYSDPMEESKCSDTESLNVDLNLKFIDNFITKSQFNSFFGLLKSVFNGKNNQYPEHLDMFGVLLMIYEIRTKHMNHIMGDSKIKKTKQDDNDKMKIDIVEEEPSSNHTKKYQSIMVQILCIFYGFAHESFRTFR